MTAATASTMSVFRRFAICVFSVAALFFASPAQADTFNGFAITVDPPCAGGETPANSSAWRYIQSIRANPAQAPRNEDIIARIQPILETAAANGDSWSLYTLGIYVYSSQAGNYSKTPADRARSKALAADALEKSARAGNCEGALALWRNRIYQIPTLLQQAQKSIAKNDDAGARSNVAAAQSDLTEAQQWRQKALDLGLANSRDAAILVQNSANTTDTSQKQIAAMQQKFDDNDRLAKDQVQKQLDQQAQAVADAKRQQEALQRFKDAVAVRSKSPSDATVILLYRAAVAGLPKTWPQHFGAGDAGGAEINKDLPALGALVSGLMMRDFSYGDNDIITVTKRGWYEDAYIVYLDVRRHSDDTHMETKFRITNQDGYWSGELVEHGY